MSRLTNKVKIKTSDGHTDFAYDTSAANIIELPHLVEGQRYTGEVIFKLGQLEDIEEELGIDLVTLFKALKDGIWTKGGYYSDQLEESPTFVNRPEIGICSYYDECDKDYNPLVHDENVMCIYTYNYECMIRQTRLKDYGETWALTREELEK